MKTRVTYYLIIYASLGVINTPQNSCSFSVCGHTYTGLFGLLLHVFLLLCTLLFKATDILIFCFVLACIANAKYQRDLNKNIDLTSCFMKGMVCSSLTQL